MRTSSFGKDQQGNPPLLDRFRRKLHCFNCGAGIFARNRDVSRSAEVLAKEGHLEQPPLREKPKLNRDIRKHHGRIQKAQMIGGKDVAAGRNDFFQPFNVYMNPA